MTGISGTMITMPDTAYVSIFTDNDLTHITEDHFEIKLIARLLDQMHVVQPPVFPLRYDDAPPSAPQSQNISFVTYLLIGTWYDYKARIYCIYIFNI